MLVIFWFLGGLLNGTGFLISNRSLSADRYACPARESSLKSIDDLSCSLWPGFRITKHSPISSLEIDKPNGGRSKEGWSYCCFREYKGARVVVSTLTISGYVTRI